MLRERRLCYGPALRKIAATNEPTATMDIKIEKPNLVRVLAIESRLMSVVETITIFNRLPIGILNPTAS